MAEQTKTTEKKPLTVAQKRKRAKKIHTWTRAGIQIVFFLLAPSLFSQAFNGIKYIFQTIAQGGVLEWNGFLKTLVLLCGFTILFGRFFCGYACAFGALGDWVYAGAEQLRKLYMKKTGKKLNTHQPSRKVQRGLQYIKYVILLLIVLLCSMGVYSGLKGWSPWDVFSMATARNLRLSGYAVGVVLLVLIILGMAWKERFFCQFLCPMGAVFSLLPALPLTRLRRHRETCLKGCSACEKGCPVGVVLDGDGMHSGECIRCGKCCGTCPKANISTGIRKWRGDEWYVSVIEGAVLLVLALFMI